jgi:lipopolysaccharide export system protein LptC
MEDKMRLVLIILTILSSCTREFSENENNSYTAEEAKVSIPSENPDYQGKGINQKAVDEIRDRSIDKTEDSSVEFTKEQIEQIKKNGCIVCDNPEIQKLNPYYRR